MFNVGAGELLAILVLALIVLGPDKLPDAAKKMGRFVGEVRRMSNGFQAEMKKAVNFDELKRDVMAGGSGPSLPPLESEVRASNPPASEPAVATPSLPGDHAAPNPAPAPAISPVTDAGQSPAA